MLAELAEAVGRRALASGLSLGATSYLAHQLHPEQLGQYVGTMALCQLTGGFVLMGLEVTPIWLLRRYPGMSRRIWAYATGMSVLIAATCIATLPWLSPLVLWLGGDSNTISHWTILPLIYAGGFVLMHTQWACLQGMMRLRAYNLLQVAYPFAFLVLIVTLASVLPQFEVAHAMWAWCGINVVGAVVGGGLVLRHLGVLRVDRPPADVAVSLRRAFVMFAGASYAANLMGAMNSRLPGILAAALMVPAAAGLFAGTLILNDVFAFFSLAIASISLPLLAGRPDDDARRADLAFACRLTSTATLAAILVFLLAFFPLCSVLLGASYATQEFRLLAAAMLASTWPQATARVLCADFAARGRPIVSAILNIPPMLVLAFGFWQLDGAHASGAVAAFCASSLLFSLLVWLMSRRTTGLRLRDIALLHRCDLARLRRPRPILGNSDANH